LPVGALTQAGKAKSTGRRSKLEVIGGNMTKSKIRKVLKLIKERESGTFGWRPLRQKLTEILGEDFGSHESVRRFVEQIKRRC